MDGLTAVGFVVVAVLATLGGCVTVTAAWYGAVTFGRQWDLWRREQRQAEVVEDIVREGPR